MAPRSRILCWDIDGTLLTTGRAGIFAWEEAIDEVLGVDISLQDYPTAGLTDVEIGSLLVEKALGRKDDERALDLIRRYGELLPASLFRKEGSVLPGVREILDAAHEATDLHSMLLTGNIAAGAAAKLSHYGLDGYFDLPNGAYADGMPDRPSVARQALALAKDQFRARGATELFVIGDTPHDIHCAAAIGARCLAVATGGYSTAELAQHEPWWLADQLPTADAFVERIRAS